MTSILETTNRTERISLSLTPEELAQWKFFNNKSSLSAFIRDAVEEYIEKLDHRQKRITKIESVAENNAKNIQKIEEDLIEIQVALAKHEILPELASDLQLKRFLDQQLTKMDLSMEDRQIYTKLRRKIK